MITVIVACVVSVVWIGCGFLSAMMVNACHPNGAPLWQKALAVVMGPIPTLLLGLMLKK